jgi:hypothetical protein
LSSITGDGASSQKLDSLALFLATAAGQQLHHWRRALPFRYPAAAAPASAHQRQMYDGSVDGKLYLPRATEWLTVRDVNGAVVGPVVQELHHLTFLQLSSPLQALQVCVWVARLRRRRPTTACSLLARVKCKAHDGPIACNCNC